MQITLTCAALPARYTGFPPALITFHGHIQAPGLSHECDIQYRWIRSDGAQSRPLSVRLGPHRWGMPVATTWTPGLRNFQGWMAIEVLSPHHVESEKAAFSVRCADILDAFHSLSLKRNLTRDVVVIFQDPHPVYANGTPIPVPTIADLQTLIGDVQSYFAENSNGSFRLSVAGVLGPFSLRYPWAHYTAADPGDADHDGWENQFSERYAEAIQSAAAQFDFSAFDRNGDKILSTDELAIVIVTPGTYARGFVRPALASDHPWSHLVVNGITFTDVIDMYTNTPPFTNQSRGALTHELVHMLLHHTDMYFADSFNPPDHYQPFRAGSYSLMDRFDLFFHLDPLSKLKFGWLTPLMVTEAGTYTISGVESAHEIHVLADHARGTREYFIVENRSTSSPSRDTGLPDAGLAIWHVIEDATVYGNLQAPSGVPAADWDSVASTDWGRRAIRLIRADPSRPLNDAHALWHGPDHSVVDLKWANGSAAFHLHSISPAGAAMQYTLG
jgi:M6 family metalloprotease-like protein